jgi:hypothetical protein
MHPAKIFLLGELHACPKHSFCPVFQTWRHFNLAHALQLRDVNHVVFNKKRHVSHGDGFAAVFALLEDQHGDRRTPIRPAPLLPPGKDAQLQQRPVAWPPYAEFSILLSRQCPQPYRHVRNPIVPEVLAVALEVLLQDWLKPP